LSSFSCAYKGEASTTNIDASTSFMCLRPLQLHLLNRAQ
jgi:hypothetical protein